MVLMTISCNDNALLSTSPRSQHCVAWRNARVRLRIIEREVQPAALVAAQGAIDDQRRDQHEVAQLDQVASDLVIPIILLHFLAQTAQAARGALQAFRGADDANVIPHQLPDLSP